MEAKLLKEYEAHQREVLARSERTVQAYVADVADFLRFAKCGNSDAASAAPRLRQLDAQTLLAFMRRPTTAQRSPGAVTWNARLAAVRSLYAYLCKIDLLESNPAMKIDRQKTFERPTVPLSLAELIALVESARTNSAPKYAARNVALFQILIHSALRVNEVVALDLDQVDMENYLFRAVRRKGGKSLAASVNDVVVEALGNYLATRAKLEPAASERALFVSERGTRLSVRAVQELVRAHGEAAGIKQRVYPHLLRHSSATAFASLGTPLRVVQEICGHASVQTTTRYVHAGGEDRRRAVEAMSRAWKEQLLRTGT